MRKLLILLLTFLTLTGCVNAYDEVGGYATGLSVDGGVSNNLIAIEVPQRSSDEVKFFNIEKNNVNAEDTRNTAGYLFKISEFNSEGNIKLNSESMRFSKSDSITLSFDVASDVVDKVKVTFYVDGNVVSESVSDITVDTSTVKAKYHHSSGTTYNGSVSIELYKNNEVSQGEVKVDNIRFTRSTPQLLVSINQQGYKENSSKIAIFQKGAGESFTVENVDTNEVVFTGKLYGEIENSNAQEINHYGDFSEVNTVGKYRIYSQTGDYSYTFEIQDGVYNELLIESLKFLTLQRCGEELPSEFAGKLAHEICHDDLAIVYSTGEKIDVSGGWHDAGDYGRYTSTQVKTINDILLAYYVYPEVFSDEMDSVDSGNGVPDVLDEAAVGLAWLQKMQIDWGPVYNAAVTQNFAGTVMPNRDNALVYVLNETNTATAGAAGSFALASIVFKDVNESKSEEYLFEAKKAYDYALLVRGGGGGANPTDFNAGYYSNISDSDEIFTAAAMLYVATHDEVYLSEISNAINNYEYSLANFSYDEVGGYGIFMLLQDEEFKKHEDYEELYEYFKRRTTDIIHEQVNDGYQMAIPSYSWGGNMHVLDRGMSLLLAYEIYEDEDLIAGAQGQFDYVLGKNAINKSFVTGFGSDSPKNVHHRPSRVSGSLITGAVVGGPDGNTGSELPRAKSYWDTYDSYTTNEVAIYYNAVLVFVSAGLNK